MSIALPFFSDNEPGIIKENSDNIKLVLNAEEIDADRLQERIEQREKLILNFLEDQSDVEESLLRDLLRTNRELTELVTLLKVEQQKVLVSFLRTRKAVKKYQ